MGRDWGRGSRKHLKENKGSRGIKEGLDVGGKKGRVLFDTKTLTAL